MLLWEDYCCFIHGEYSTGIWEKGIISISRDSDIYLLIVLFRIYTNFVLEYILILYYYNL